MPSLHDPFDLLKAGQEMDNVVPFLAPNKVNQMINAALAQSQLPAKKPVHHLTRWKYGGLAIAASLAFFMVFLSPVETPVMESDPPSLRAQVSSSEDVSEFGELVILENWERF